MMMLSVTHLSQYRANWLDELGYDGWFLRFTGDELAFDDMRDELKTWGRAYARWVPDYRWRDGKMGAWWIDDGLFQEEYTDRFAHLQEAMDALREDEILQWIAPRRERRQTRRTRSQAWMPPAHLLQDYRLLGIGPTATLQEAKDAYRRQAKKQHPDAGGTHGAFIALQSAYEHVSQFLKTRERVAV